MLAFAADQTQTRQRALARRRVVGNLPPVRALTIGASTGGPQALASLLAMLKPAIARIPVLLVQHMPATFTELMAENLSSNSGAVVRPAVPGERILAGQVYLAPGDRHMEVASGEYGELICLNHAPPMNYCRPSVDRLFASAAEAWGNRVVALLLTGMGHDGAEGARVIADRGGAVFVQDEASSVVWGMPGAAVENGSCLAVLTLAEMAAVINRNVGRVAA